MKEQRTRRHETYYIEGGNISMLFILLILRFTALRLSLLGPDPPPTWTHITSVPLDQVHTHSARQLQRAAFVQRQSRALQMQPCV